MVPPAPLGSKAACPPAGALVATGRRCAGWHDGRVQHFDLVIIGSGSGNSIPDERFADLSIALVDKGVFGGTCLNVGCIPTKMFVHPADLAASPGHAARVGVDLELRAVRFAEIQDAIRVRDVKALKSLWDELVPL